MFISAKEIFDIIVMTFAIGYIFSGFIGKRRDVFNWQDIKYSMIVAAPAVVLHELSHKFVAMAFGANAVLHAPYGMYIVVILLRLIHFPILFFVGGYVSHSPLPALESSLVALAGPLVNLFLWVFALVLLKNKTFSKHYHYLIPMAKLNMFLFIFNMLPVPGFDGYWFLRGLISGLL